MCHGLFTRLALSSRHRDRVSVRRQGRRTEGNACQALAGRRPQARLGRARRIRHTRRDRFGMLHNSAEQPLQPCRACLQALKGHTGTQLLQNLTAASNFASCTPCQQPLRPSSALRKRRSAGSHLAAAVASRRRAQCPPRRNLQPPTWRGRRAAPPQDLGRSSVARPGAQAHRAGVEPAAWSSSRCREARAGARERATTLARRGGGLFLISYSEVRIWVWRLVWRDISLFGETKALTRERERLWRVGGVR